MHDDTPNLRSGPNRRAVLAAGGIATVSTAMVVTGCSTYDSAQGGSAPPSGDAYAAPTSSAEVGAGAGSAGGAPGGASAAPGGTPLGPTSSVPVGGGKVFAAQKVVVTQPTAGTFRAFSSTCTHAGCTVGTVSGGTINCPCHGSSFNASDGSVANGPAKRALAARQVSAEGGTLRLS